MTKEEFNCCLMNWRSVFTYAHLSKKEKKEIIREYKRWGWNKYLIFIENEKWTSIKEDRTNNLNLNDLIDDVLVGSILWLWLAIYLSV